MFLNKKNEIIASFFIYLIIFSRILPHMPNFTGVFAIITYSSLFLRKKMIFFLFLSFVSSDLIIGYHDLSILIWFLLILIIILTYKFRKKISGTCSRILMSLLAVFVFFIITNAATWLTGHNTYQINLSGFIECFQASIPFFKNNLISSALYCFVFEIIIFSSKKHLFV